MKGEQHLTKNRLSGGFRHLVRTLLHMGDIFDLVYVQRQGGLLRSYLLPVLGNSVDRMTLLLRSSSLSVLFREAKRDKFGVTRV